MNLYRAAVRSATAIAFSVWLSGCGKFIYGVDIVNYGQNGVIVLQMSHYDSYVRKPYTTMAANKKTELYWDPRTPGIEDVAHVTRLYPSIPSKYRNPATAFGRFSDHPKSLPDEIEVVWQLAELKDCKKTVGVNPKDTIATEIKARGYNPEDHVLKSNCTWAPIPNKIFRKKIDMAAIRASEAYKRTGKSNPGTALSRYTFLLRFVFQEDQMTVKAENGTTNPWL